MLDPAPPRPPLAGSALAEMSSVGMSRVRTYMRPLASTAGQRAFSFFSPPAPPDEPPAVTIPGMEVPWNYGKSVYRKLLRAARVYPSRKRDGMYEDIRLDFKVSGVSRRFACLEGAPAGKRRLFAFRSEADPATCLQDGPALRKET